MGRYYVFSKEEIEEIRKFYEVLPLSLEGTIEKDQLLAAITNNTPNHNGIIDAQDKKSLLKELTSLSTSFSFDFTDILQLLSRAKASEDTDDDDTGTNTTTTNTTTTTTNPSTTPSLSTPSSSTPSTTASSSGGSSGSAPTPRTHGNKAIHEVTTITGGTHSFSDAERNMLVSHINRMPAIVEDPELLTVLPIQSDRFFKSMSDGVILCKLINAIRPGTIDKRKIGTVEGNKKNSFKAVESLVAGIKGASSIGLTLVNVGAEDFLEKRAHLILGVVWQIVKADLLSKVALSHHPELCQLVGSDESLSQLLYMPPEQVLVRWFNYHLQRAGSSHAITNFTSDLKDCENYILLLNQIAPGVCSVDLLKETVEKRAELFVEAVKQLDGDLYLAPQDIIAGNGRVNLAFVAELFNLHSGMELPTEKEAEKLKADNQILSKRLQEMEEQLKKLQIEKDRKLAMNFVLERHADTRPKGLFERVGKSIDVGLTEIENKYHISDKTHKIKEDLTHTSTALVEKAKNITASSPTQPRKEPKTKEEKKAKLEAKLAALKEYNKTMEIERKERLNL